MSKFFMNIFSKKLSKKLSKVMKIGLIYYIESFHDKRSHKKVCRKFHENIKNHVEIFHGKSHNLKCHTPVTPLVLILIVGTRTNCIILIQQWFINAPKRCLSEDYSRYLGQSGVTTSHTHTHTHTQADMLSHTLTSWLAHMLQCFITVSLSQQTAVEQQLCHTAGH